MLEEFRSLSARDFRQRYAGSYGYFTTPEKRRVLVWVEGVSDAGDYVDFIDANQTHYKALADTGVEFEFIPVVKRLFEWEKKLMLVNRHTARMWSRGVNNANTRIQAVALQRWSQLSFPLIIAAFERIPQNVLHNVLRLERKETTIVVLSDTFGVEGGALYVYEECIGKFITDGRQIVLNDDMFRQEIMDLVQKHSLPYTVVSNG